MFLSRCFYFRRYFLVAFFNRHCSCRSTSLLLYALVTKKASVHSDENGSEHSDEKSNDEKQAINENNNKMQQEENRKAKGWNGREK